MGIELNGISNISMIVESLQEEFTYGMYPGKEVSEGVQKIKDQAVMLERYMLAYSDAVKAGVQPPHWHEILANPNNYPTNRERVGK